MGFSTSLSNKETREIVTKRKNVLWYDLTVYTELHQNKKTKKKKSIPKNLFLKHLSQKTQNMSVNRFPKASRKPKKPAIPRTHDKVLKTSLASLVIFP